MDQGQNNKFITQSSHRGPPGELLGDVLFSSIAVLCTLLNCGVTSGGGKVITKYILKANKHNLSF